MGNSGILNLSSIQRCVCYSEVKAYECTGVGVEKFLTKYRNSKSVDYESFTVFMLHKVSYKRC